MRRYKQLLTGILIGGVFTSGGTVLAKSEISAVVADWINFKFNGKEQSLPEGYTTLIYNDRTYVPARFIAEQLGANVNWDEKTQTVTITKPVTPDESKQQEKKYEKLPVSDIKEGVQVEVYDIQPREDRTHVYLKVKNITDKPMQFDQTATYLEAESILYKNKDMEGPYNQKDNTWYNDIREEQKSEGFVVLPEIPEDIKKGTLYLKVIQNDGSQKEINFKFNFSW